MTDSFLHGRLRQLKRRLLSIGLVSAAGWGLALAAVGLIVGMWLDLVLELSPRLRIGSAVVALAVGVCLVVAVLIHAWRKARLDSLARRLDSVGASRGQILTGIDLLFDGRARVALTGGLAAIAVERAAVLTREIPSARAVPARPVGWALGSVMLVGLAVGLIAALLPRLARTQYMRFVDPFGDHPPYSRVILAVEPGDFSVVYGQGQDIVVKAEGPPLDRLDIVLLNEGTDQEEILPMFGEPDGRWRATIAGVTNPGQYFVRSRSVRSHRYRIDVITVPKLEEMRFRITPPAYTNRGAYEGPLPQGGIAGLPGTVIDLRARSNRPLSGGTLKVMERDRHGAEKATLIGLAPVSAGESEVEGRFEIREPGLIEVTVCDTDGQASQERFAAAVTVLPDDRPFVRLLDPPTVSLATPSVAVPVALDAEDDYGISRLQLYRSLNDSRSLPMDLEVSAPPPTRLADGAVLPLATYGVRPGDEIKLFARVEDNDPAAAKGSETPVALIRIISQEDFEQLILTREGMEVLQAKYAEARRRLEDLAMEIEKLQKEIAELPPDSELAQEKREQVSRFAEEMRKQASELRKAAENLLPYDLDQALTRRLEEMAEGLDEAADVLDEFNDSASPPKAGEMAETLKDLAEALKGQRDQYDEDVTQPLEQLAKIYPLLEDQARFTALYQEQKDLAERLASLKGKDSGDDPELRARMRDLEAEQFRIRERLNDLLQDIEDHIAQLPEDKEIQQLMEELDQRIEELAALDENAQDEKTQQRREKLEQRRDQLQQFLEGLDTLTETANEFVRGVRGSGAAEAMSDAESGLAEFSGTRGYEAASEAEQILLQFLSQCQSMGEGGQACMRFAPGLGEGLGATVDQLLAGAGMKVGMSGVGGAGGGYSARTSTLDNVGLYGQLPTMAGGPNERTRRDAAAVGFGPGRDGESRGGREPGRVEATEPLRAAGAGETAVPVQYRQRVGAYFERVADEVGDKE